VKTKLIFVFLAAATTFLPAGSGTAWAVSLPINLLPMGDSITDTGWYFNPLLASLTDHGYTPTILADEGHWGYIIQGNISGAPRAGLVENISAYMNHPGVNADNSYILLMIGANDVTLQYNLNSTDVPNVQTRMSTLISSITGIAPQAHLIVAQITPQLNLGDDANVQQFNLDVAAAVNAASGNVSLVDMYTPFHPSLYSPYTGVPSPYMADSVHPNQAGGEVMAQVWFDGIQAIQTPEPSTLVLLAAGLVGLLAYAWRKRR
jgi:hypothetical protein